MYIIKCHFRDDVAQDNVVLDDVALEQIIPLEGTSIWHYSAELLMECR